jgi:hypothetical protein
MGRIRAAFERVPSVVWALLVGLVVAGLVRLTGWPTEIMAGVTAVYAGLVFFQLHVMERERKERAVRPRLRMGPFQPEPPLLRLASEVGGIGGFGYYVTIPIVNEGPQLARRCQPLLTGWAKASDRGWEREQNWVPIGLLWALDEWARSAAGRPTEEKDLVPDRPYLFNLGKISNSDAQHFVLLPVLAPTAQQHRFPPGEYCFEVTAFAENTDSVTRWYRVIWRGSGPKGLSKEFSQFMARFQVRELDAAPWASCGEG